MSLEKPDPIGGAIKAYWQGQQDAAVTVYSDQMEADELPAAYLFRTSQEMPEREQFALQEARGRVLDIGAGAGSHALALQEKGLEVTALEISEKAAQVQEARGVQNILVGDFFSLEATPHDTLLLLMNGIGLAGTLDNLPHFLDTCKKWLAPGGQILLESSDILYLYEEEDGSVLLDLNGAYYGELTYMMEFGQERTEPFPWLFIDFDLLQQYAEEAGFQAELLLQEEDDHYIARLTLA
ncbi:methyltransferase domain-containing protein [Rufibacter latericius]|uniref:Class I SAM-dependent methyltransferase n=1 Tax=Rufibacter latericius TaxID=2487040 RepID=A0A3M9MAZ6_9BACT|nr:methyltransferase domain-containing protein [Rufibacter latericius]RNI22716.1 class I SAM-dependent methyltransferase [Rufibacter latericius]